MCEAALAVGALQIHQQAWAAAVNAGFQRVLNVVGAQRIGGLGHAHVVGALEGVAVAVLGALGVERTQALATRATVDAHLVGVLLTVEAVGADAVAVAVIVVADTTHAVLVDLARESVAARPALPAAVHVRFAAVHREVGAPPAAGVLVRADA